MHDNTESAALARFIRKHQDTILEEWIRAVCDLPQLCRLPSPLLVDSLPEILKHIAEGLEAAGAEPTLRGDTPERRHANVRFEAGVDLQRVRAEYRALREVTLRLWWNTKRSEDIEALLRFTALLDEVFDSTFDEYASARERAAHVGSELPTPSREFGTQELASFSLDRALSVTATAHSGAVWLLQHEQLYLAASAGEAGGNFPEPATLARIMKTPAPQLLENDGKTAWVLPVMENGQGLGVLAITGAQLTEEDQRLLQVVADHLGLTLHLRTLQEQTRQHARALQQITEIVERSDPLLVLDRNWRIIRVNQSQEQLSGLARSTSVGRDFWEVFPAAAETDTPYRQAMQMRRPTFFETYYRPFQRWFDVAIYPTQDAGLAIFFRDITERKQAEDQVIDAERRFRLLVDSVQDYAIMLLDAEGRIVSWNPGVQRILGYSEEDVVGQPFSLFYTQADRAAQLPQRLLDKASRQGHARIEGWRVRKDGSAFWADVVYSAITDSTGRASGYAKIVRDLTEQKRRESSLAFLEEAGHALAQALGFTETAERVAELAVPRLADWCVVDYLEDQQRTRALAVTHVDRSKIPWAQELRRRYPPLPDAPHGAFKAIRSGEPELIEEVTDEMLAALAPDDEYLQILQELGMRSAMVLPLIARGHTLGAITLISAGSGHIYSEEDFTFAKQVSARLALALDNARLFDSVQEESRLREELLAIVSHDLRTPLATIGLSTEMLLRNRPKQPLRHQLGILRTAVAQMDRLIGDLMDMASIQRGALRIEARPCVITPLLTASAAVHHELAGKDSIELTKRLEIPAKLQVCCDPQRIEQVLANLLGNAIKFSRPGGSIQLSAYTRKGALHVEVLDRGPGVAPDDLAHIFEPYRRGAQSLSTGLGLYISKGIVEAHGGQIGARSVPGQGSCFFFTLPMPDV